ncbi:hypothetical protein FKM82_024697 [Ascaphus truei]
MCSCLYLPVPVTAPSVFPLIPCCDNVNLQTQVTLGCLVSGYLPDQVEIQWNSGNITSGILTMSSVYNPTIGVFTRSSQITIPGSKWDNSTYQCSVVHPTTGTKQEKTVRVLPCIQPTVQLLHQSPCSSSSPTMDVNSTLDLVCLISGFYPGNIQVKWLMNGKKDLSTGASLSAPLKTKDGTYSANSHLRILKGQWNSGTQYSCTVTHLPSNTTKTANIIKCAEPCTSLEVFLIPPSFEDIYFTKNVQILCLVSSMRNIENFEMSWTREKSENLDVVREDPILYDNGTYSSVSILKVCAEDWASGEKFTCTVKNQELPSPIKKTIFKHNEGISKAPSVHLLPPPQEDLLQQEMASITCFVTGFYPEDIFIKWQHESKEVSNHEFVSTRPMKKEGEETYFLYSKLTISAEDWNKGDTFTCSVGHEALPYNLKQQSIDKSSVILWVTDECSEEEDIWATAATFMVLFLLTLFYTATVTVFKVITEVKG